MKLVWLLESSSLRTVRTAAVDAQGHVLLPLHLKARGVPSNRGPPATFCSEAPPIVWNAPQLLMASDAGEPARYSRGPLPRRVLRRHIANKLTPEGFPRSFRGAALPSHPRLMRPIIGRHIVRLCPIHFRSLSVPRKTSCYSGFSEVRRRPPMSSLPHLLTRLTRRQGPQRCLFKGPISTRSFLFFLLAFPSLPTLVLKTYPRRSCVTERSAS